MQIHYLRESERSSEVSNEQQIHEDLKLFSSKISSFHNISSFLLDPSFCGQAYITVY